MIVDIHLRNYSNRRLSLSHMSRAKFTKVLPWQENERAMKWNYLHLRPRVESITDDNVASNCSITRKYFSKRSVFLKFYFYLCYVYRQILLFVLQH